MIGLPTLSNPPSETRHPKQKGPGQFVQALDLTGAGEESRTPDLRITNALLYQLSYTGTEALHGRVPGAKT
jgi:hypothetical protein